jgi:hypothetical protein
LSHASFDLYQIGCHGRLLAYTLCIDYQCLTKWPLHMNSDLERSNDCAPNVGVIGTSICMRSFGRV